MERTEAKIEELQNTNAMLYVQGGSREGLWRFSVVCVYMYVCVCMCVCVYVCMYVCMYVLMYDYIYVLFVCRV